ncbi:MAG: amylo-alpha-1,6-glucosidase [Capnocytophaga sp.]|nr:amylo-alpha-1,6-glucosidase [Capnocytophaga sp.]
MSYLTFKKNELVNLEYSLDREFLGTNRGGGYSSSTLVFCNTRKYHGLLVLPLENFKGRNHVLLSSLDETLIQHGREFNFGVHKYPGTYEPRGHKYIIDVSYEKTFAVTYQVGGVVLKKEILMMHKSPQVLVRYTLLEAHSPTTLRLNPLLAFRDAHILCKANDIANQNYGETDNGITAKLYTDFPELHLQLNKKADFIHEPYWNLDISYKKEKERGYDYKEDLLSLGYFEFPIKKGESVVFSAGTEADSSRGLKQKFTRVLERRSERNTFEDCLRHSASQYLIDKVDETRIKAGYHWHISYSRDTFVALPGIALANNQMDAFGAVFSSVKKYFSNGLFEKTISTHSTPQYDADTSLWFFWTLQQYEKYSQKTKKQLWKEFGDTLKTILETYRQGTHKVIRMDESGLIWAEDISRPLTWVDAQTDRGALISRGGFAVEVNALWFNAVCYAIALATEANDKKFLAEWETLPEQIGTNFKEKFWLEKGGYLADSATYSQQNTEIRPNQIITCGLDYSPLTEKERRKVMGIVTQNLFTARGLRTLSPKNPNYKGSCIGTIDERDLATFNGSVHPWFLGFYTEANLKLYGKTYIADAEEIIAGFEEEMTSHGVSTLSEVYDGNPPFAGRGCISNARNVAEMIRSLHIIKEYKEKL